MILLVAGGTLLGESWPTIEAILKPLERGVLVGLVALSAAAVGWKIRGTCAASAT